MKSAKIFPRLSLLLLLIAYTTFGWYLSSSLREAKRIVNIREMVHHISKMSLPDPSLYWLVWLLSACFSLLLAGVLLASPTKMDGDFARFFRGNIITYFGTVCLACIGLVFALFWIRVVADFLVIIATQILARVEIQIAGFSKVQTFLILSAVSLVGLGIGGITSHLFLNGGLFT